MDQVFFGLKTADPYLKGFFGVQESNFKPRTRGSCPTSKKFFSQSKHTTPFAHHNFVLVLIPLYRLLCKLYCNMHMLARIINIRLLFQVKNMDFRRFLFAFGYTYLCIVLLSDCALADEEEKSENEAVSLYK